MTEITKVNTEQHVENQHAPAIPASDPMVSMIERIAMSPDLPIDRLERMMDMKERMDAKEAEQQFNAAFAQASADFPAIPMRGEGHNRRPYATHADIVKHTRPTLSKHGLSLSWDTVVKDGAVTVTAILSHVGGHARRTEMVLPADTSGSKNAVQAVGSTQTYGMRYTAQAILGLSLGEDTDDDAQALSNTISPDQAQSLRNMITETSSDEVKLCAFFNVDRLEDLPGKAYPRADKMLRAKIKEAQQ